MLMGDSLQTRSTVAAQTRSTGLQCGETHLCEDTTPFLDQGHGRVRPGTEATGSAGEAPMARDLSEDEDDDEPVYIVRKVKDMRRNKQKNIFEGQRPWVELVSEPK